MTDKRSYDRYNARIRVEARLEFSPSTAQPAGRLIECQTRDLSLAGICLQVSEVLAVGSRLLLAIEISPPHLVFNHLAEVVWCRESDAGFLVGVHLEQHLCDELAWRNAVLKILAA